MAYSFWKMFFIGQNLNHVHMTYSFLELLIFFLTQVDIYFLELFLTTSQKYCIWIQTPKETNHEIKGNIFTCFFLEIKTNIFTCIFNIKLNIPYEQLYFFSVSWTHFQKQPFADVLQIGALKDFTIFWIKKRFKQRCFSVNLLTF